MRDELPKDGPRFRESIVVNLDDSRGLGTYWVACKKRGGKIEYFDSFGDLRPPHEITRYFDGYDVRYNSKRYQNFDTYNCGHLCLQFLCDAI